MNFKGCQFPSSFILMVVRYYISYKLSTRDIEEIFTERGSAIDHSTINRGIVATLKLYGFCRLDSYWHTEVTK
jgi:transposase-like protein